MVGEERKYIQHEYVNRTIAKTDERGLVQNVGFQLNIRDAKLTDAEVAGLRDILRESAERANTLLGW